MLRSYPPTARKQPPTDISTATSLTVEKCSSFDATV